MTKYMYLHSLLRQNNYLATINVIESFVCQLYLPHTELTNVADASSWLFKKK